MPPCSGEFTAGISRLGRPSAPSSRYTGSGVDAGEELASRVGPEVFGGAGDVDRAGGCQGNEHVLIDRQLLLAAVVASKPVAEPVREPRVDEGDVFAVAAPRQGRPAAPGVVADGHGEALVAGAGPQGGLAEAGVPHHRHPVRVDVGIGFQVVADAAQAPCPGADRAPVPGGGTGLPVKGMERVHPVPVAVVEIRVEVAAVSGRQPVTAAQDQLCLPAVRQGAPRAVVGAVVLDSQAVAVANPAVGKENRRIVLHGLVAEEVETGEHRHRLRAGSRQVQQDTGLGDVAVGLPGQRDLPAGRPVPEDPLLDYLDSCGCSGVRGRTGCPAVHVVFEQTQDFPPPPRPCRCADGGAVLEMEGIRQLVLRNRFLVVVDRYPGCGLGAHGLRSSSMARLHVGKQAGVAISPGAGLPAHEEHRMGVGVQIYPGGVGAAVADRVPRPPPRRCGSRRCRGE